MMRPFVIHAHFYQPERANPWTGELDPEPSAAPYRDWNERIMHECYRPNGAARIYGKDGLVERIVNNYERLSFNFGPTLLSWMQRASPDTYAKVLDGDRQARARTRHGNAIAQAYNHMILPLANDRDRRTQIRWGLADFRSRFGRDAKGLWLPETAVDRATIDALIDEGVTFTVLAPHQIARVRFADGDWHTADSGFDTGCVYLHRHSDGSGRSIGVFVYDGGLAQALAFDPVTGDTAVLLDRLQAAGAGHGGLIHAALDGETFGHHHRLRELGLAYALFGEAQARGLEPTSYEAYYAAHPPTVEIEVVSGEGTAWSCAHGVGRWYRDCGCTTNPQNGWSQAWRTPLRQALDVVRDAAAAAFEQRGGELLVDPWAARDDSIAIRLGQLSRPEFLKRHARQRLSRDQQVDLWTLLEAQRHAMVMYTSCGWFFADVSGIETRYVLRSAHRVLGLLEEVGIRAPWAQVRAILGEAQSNQPGVGTGTDVWREHIEPAAVSPARVAAHLALVGLVRPLQTEGVTAGHAVIVHSHRRERRGRAGLSTAQLETASVATGRRTKLDVAAVHLGGLDVYGSVSQHRGDETFRTTNNALWAAFPTTPLAQLIKLIAELLPGNEFGFEALLPDGVQEVVGATFSDLRTRFREQYARLYHDHRRFLEMLVAAGYTLPRELRAAAELTLDAELERLLASVRGPDGASPRITADSGVFEWVRATVDLARTQGYELNLEPVADAVAIGLVQATRRACTNLDEADAAAVEGWVALSEDLDITVDLTLAQELVCDLLTRVQVDRRGTELAIRLGRSLQLSPVAWSASGE
jgi:alpha-amylase/alpha-mannosidase (GH57 family)